ncbi:VanZ family protein [Streptomyces lancefieldiae]|uniref:VanZ family protein n=1 Tax=Streptomyces lancefieldiae TaxID=3075520 RepID=A0ABU3B0X7_9ACTN|nr:VanZ family protein [Streptomyces sp. DSM 40712]MDT0616089.1 VanZ family protein [Streptomyces sp. DSM 40712]
MFTAIFQNHYGYLATCALAGLILGGAAWLLSHRLGKPFGLWWGGLTATVAGVLGVTFLGAGTASRQCVVNHNLTEPFHATQGLWNLAMTVPLGLFALLAVRRFLPALVGVVVLPLAIEFTQATVDGLGRVCDSADAEMNILGGLLGLALAAAVLAQRRGLNWRGGATASLITSVVIAILGAGVARPMVALTHVDGTGLTAAGSQQRQAVEAVVQEAFGDHYKLGDVYEQPCVGAPCTTVVFNLLSRDAGHSEEFSSGSLTWPDKEHLNVLLVDSDRPSVMGYPVPGGGKPSTEQEAYQIAQKYMSDHYPWAKGAFTHKTYPVGENAVLGWMTSYRWVHNDVLMPRMLDIQVSRAGQISQVDVTLGPTEVSLPQAKLDAEQAEAAVLDGLVAQARANQATDVDSAQLKAQYTIEAFTLKAAKRNGAWRSEWLVNLAMREQAAGTGSDPVPEPDMWRVDAANGQVYDGTNTPVKN